MQSKTNSRPAVSLYRLRLEAIKAYGGKCICCEETAVLFLTIDHITPILRKNLDKNSLNKELAQLRRESWPQGEHQVLCMNCNFAKRTAERCPHTTETVEEALFRVKRHNRTKIS